jgi:hypothetical protein
MLNSGPRGCKKLNRFSSSCCSSNKAACSNLVQIVRLWRQVETASTQGRNTREQPLQAPQWSDTVYGHNIHVKVKLSLCLGNFCIYIYFFIIKKGHGGYVARQQQVLTVVVCIVCTVLLSHAANRQSAVILFRHRFTPQSLCRLCEVAISHRSLTTLTT